MNYYIHNIDPIALNIAGIIIPWYWLFYFIGVLLVYFISKNIIKLERYPIKILDLLDYLQIGWVGVVVGGRLGYVLFYNLNYYLSSPLDIFYIWKGGMSFHGAVAGLCLSFYFQSKYKKQSFFLIADLIAYSSAPTLFFGRLGNFINGELAGRPTDLPWAVVFSKYYGNVPRHPSQLYEAFLEGIVLFIILYQNKNKLKSPGKISGLFLFWYGFLRFAVEFFRLPDYQIGHIFGITMGQWFCLAMMLAGSILYLIKIDQSKRSI